MRFSGAAIAHCAITAGTPTNYLSNQSRFMRSSGLLTFQHYETMSDIRSRLEALICDSGMFNSGVQHERDRILTMLKLRMEQLDSKSVAYRECQNLFMHLMP